MIFLLVLVRFLNFCVSCKCRNLRVLDLQENYVEDQSGYWLGHFPESCTSLEVLNLACLEGEVNFSVLERLVARCPNLRTLRLNQAVPLEKLANILRRAPQLVDLGTGAFSADPRQELYSKLANAFEGSKSLKSLSGFWSVVPSYLPAIYSVCAGLTSLNLSYATIQSTELVNLISQCHNLQRLLVCPFISTMTTTAVLCPFWQFGFLFPCLFLHPLHHLLWACWWRYWLCFLFFFISSPESSQVWQWWLFGQSYLGYVLVFK